MAKKKSCGPPRRLPPGMNPYTGRPLRSRRRPMGRVPRIPKLDGAFVMPLSMLTPENTCRICGLTTHEHVLMTNPQVEERKTAGWLVSMCYIYTGDKLICSLQPKQPNRRAAIEATKKKRAIEASSVAYRESRHETRCNEANELQIP